MADQTLNWLDDAVAALRARESRHERKRAAQKMLDDLNRLVRWEPAGSAIAKAALEKIGEVTSIMLEAADGRESY